MIWQKTRKYKSLNGASYNKNHLESLSRWTTTHNMRFAASLQRAGSAINKREFVVGLRRKSF